MRCFENYCSHPLALWHGRVVEWARDYWYTYFKHIREGLLEGRMPPIDFHEIISLIAPRP